MAINKLYYLFFVFILLQACNIEPVDKAGDNIAEEPTSIDKVLLRKEVSTDSDNEQYVIDYIYDGNRLLEISTNYGNEYTFLYEDDKLVRINQLVDNELNSYMTVDYNSDGKVSSYSEYFISFNPPSAYKESLVYNNDNSITKNSYAGDLDSQTQLTDTSIAKLVDNNIVSIESTTNNDMVSFEYDNKNGMFKNVFANDVLHIISDSGFGSLFLSSNNNLIAITDKEGNNTYKESYEYIYSSNNFPSSAIYNTEGYGADEEISIEYFYE